MFVNTNPDFITPYIEKKREDIDDPLKLEYMKDPDNLPKELLDELRFNALVEYAGVHEEEITTEAGKLFRHAKKVIRDVYVSCVEAEPLCNGCHLAHREGRRRCSCNTGYYDPSLYDSCYNCK